MPWQTARGAYRRRGDREFLNEVRNGVELRRDGSEHSISPLAEEHSRRELSELVAAAVVVFKQGFGLFHCLKQMAVADRDDLAFLQAS